MNKLHSVKPVLGDWQSSYRRCRKDEVVLCRARIGHTHLTHSYILRKDPPPVCEHCQCILTVRHILVECNHFAQERKDIFGRNDVVESFRFHPTLIVLFLSAFRAGVSLNIHSFIQSKMTTLKLDCASSNIFINFLHLMSLSPPDHGKTNH